MIETLGDIARDIKARRNSEVDQHANIYAIGRNKGKLNGGEMTFWLTSRQNNGNVNWNQAIQDLPGHISVYKNLPIGEILIAHHAGQHIYNAPGGPMNLEIYNRTTYRPDPNNRNAYDLTFNLEGQSLLRPSLSELLEEIEQLEQGLEVDRSRLEEVQRDQIESVGEVLEDEAITEESLLEKIASQETQLNALYAKSKSFIREQVKLRYQPILDPIQESIKRSNIYSGTVCIDGGPGTGKTTSLIQRIKFLLDEEFLRDEEMTKEYLKDLSPSEIKVVREGIKNNNWIFFSPNELLSIYLKDSMNREGLQASTKTVSIWKNYRRDLFRAYKLTDSDTRSPFLMFRNNDLLIQENPKDVLRYYEDFQETILDKARSKFQTILDIEVEHFSWKRLGGSIQQYIQQNVEIETIRDLYRVYYNLNKQFNDQFKGLNQRYKELLDKSTEKLIAQIPSETIEDIKALFNSWIEEAEDDDQGKLEGEDFGEQGTAPVNEFEILLARRLKALIRKMGLNNFEKSSLSSRDRALRDLIGDLDKENYKSIGDLAYLKKHFERITLGISRNVLKEIPMLYKQFRKDENIRNRGYWNQALLEKIIQKDNNKRLHNNEIAFLISVINELVVEYLNTYPSVARLDNDKYIKGYMEYKKVVIAVDEASDFHLLDLKCMYSFKDYRVGSVTYSGDIMQRMTAEGIKDWRHMELLLPNVDVRALEKSYRQSPSLLDLAKRVYQESRGKQPIYDSFLKKDPEEPKPLLMVDSDENERIAWMVQRILEINTAYGDVTFPSIAIFVPNESELDRTAKLMQEYDELFDVGIEVQACRDGAALGDSKAVRIFSIDNIKGLEFEAVFFHNIDRMKDSEKGDLILNYLYVGLSRATFYMGLTAEANLTGNIAFLNDELEQGVNWKKEYELEVV